LHADGPEICGNAIDDNCNGIIDEGCGLRTGKVQFEVGVDRGLRGRRAERVRIRRGTASTAPITRRRRRRR